jgi:hypothetical protein
MRNILSITNTDPIIVTTTFDGITPGDNSYKSGLIVRLYIPQYFGMPEVNHAQGTITVLSSSQFTMPIDGTRLEPFSIPSDQPGSLYTPAQVVPIGEVTQQFDQAVRNVLPYP